MRLPSSRDVVEEVIEDEDSWDDGEEVVVEDEVLRVLLLCPRAAKICIRCYDVHLTHYY